MTSIFTKEALEYYNSIKGLDPPRTVVVKPTSRYIIDVPNTPLVDYIIYKCPVRGVRAFALEDNQGRHWCGMPFVVGGWVYYYHTKYDEENTYSLILTDDAMVHAARNLLQNLIDHDCHQGLIKAEDPEASLSVYCDGLPWDSNSKRVIPYYDQNRAQLIYEFDKEYGAGAYFKSQRAARDKHVYTRSAKGYRARAREAAKDDIKPENSNAGA